LKGDDYLRRIIAYNAVEPRSTVNLNNPITIAHSPSRTTLANLRIVIPRGASRNKVELIGTVGVEGLTDIPQLLFRIFRDGKQIFTTQQGVESADSERVYTISFQAIDRNLRSGAHTYRLTVENLTPVSEAAVVGPVSFSALAIQQRTRHIK
jgi:hypothetical protein